MSNLKIIITEKKWTFILIYFILLFNPIFYFWADNISLKDKNAPLTKDSFKKFDYLFQHVI